MKAKYRIQNAGFTLIEVSIVLVIVGLIVGGVLIGRDLIKSAEIRSTIGQYEKFNTAVNTFKIKYGGIPGDILSTKALAFGLYCIGGSPTTCTGGNGRGDDSSLINSFSARDSFQGVGEPLLFWRHLTDVGLIDGSYGSTIDQVLGESTVASMANYFPSAKIDNSVYWMAGNINGMNYYLLTTGTMSTGIDVATTASGGTTPNIAYAIDSKIDDGMPNTGTVQARGTKVWAVYLLKPLTDNYGVNHLEGAEAAGDCTVTPASVGVATPLSPLNTYSRVAVSGNVRACGLVLKFQ